ncbi:MAG: 1-phosphofructokinase [Clostridia bacterium]|nr:1-phosphofructokinase [Clostridia bacterium]
MIYTVTCNPALDYTLKTETFTAGKINRAESTRLTYGGKGINVSAVLTALGIPTTALGFIGGANGERLAALMQADGIPSDFIRLSAGETRINVKIKAEEEWDLNAPGPQIDERALQGLMDRLDRLQAGDYLVLSGSVSAGLPVDLYRQMLCRIKERGAEAVVDAEGALLRQTLDFKPFLVKPNHLELGELYGVKLHSLGEIEEYARKLQGEGARNVLVSCGAQGALLLDEHGRVHKGENAKGLVKNTVGCGDSMVAGFLAGWIKGGSYEQALRWGVACGNATAFSDTLATKQEILNLLK